MSQAKTASKNNPTSREQSKEFFFQGQKIKPVKLITSKFSFLAAEFDGSGDLVMGTDGQPLPWERAKNG